MTLLLDHCRSAVRAAARAIVRLRIADSTGKKRSRLFQCDACRRHEPISPAEISALPARSGNSLKTMRFHARWKDTSVRAAAGAPRDHKTSVSQGAFVVRGEFGLLP